MTACFGSKYSSFHLPDLVVDIELLAQDNIGILQNGLDEGEQNQRIIWRLRIDQRQRVAADYTRALHAIGVTTTPFVVPGVV